MTTSASRIEIPDTIERWPLARLKPYERNARTHSPEQVAKIAASIVEFGFTNPILVDGKDGIIAGHGRLMFVDVIVRRWQEFTGQKAILEGDGWTFEETVERRAPVGE